MGNSICMFSVANDIENLGTIADVNLSPLVCFSIKGSFILNNVMYWPVRFELWQVFHTQMGTRFPFGIDFSSDHYNLFEPFQG